MRGSARSGSPRRRGPRAALASLALLLAACCAPAAGTSAGPELALRAALRAEGGRMVAWPLGGGAPIVLEDPGRILDPGWDGRTAYLRLRPARAGTAPRVVVSAAPIAAGG